MSRICVLGIHQSLEAGGNKHFLANHMSKCGLISCTSDNCHSDAGGKCCNTNAIELWFFCATYTSALNRFPICSKLILPCRRVSKRKKLFVIQLLKMRCCAAAVRNIPDQIGFVGIRQTTECRTVAKSCQLTAKILIGRTLIHTFQHLFLMVFAQLLETTRCC